ncbi:DUF5714 domain-containing protein [Methanocorpusculum vombati]|uniref:DUF5714 domain-containing protein n=1 Tax=Methanocorpusculum vombati TaxID=3002864 RepID=A0ABT4ILK4_9EURY|nr:DUF5714 domain-containing protein [Methanocorpusculum vombati]MCZ9318592.1 DUF5714 domain-containing protein [Methanocorpusculum sp.]MCZ0862627.1 DUF5714 domain-containing protein [Methanocorpusculum vombati]MDE2521023.1 DUF5714 domain-containing protein [Methanocorpusculum sp.]MDE2534018.1 DUF5714 domain-containing protein [Methanocorpusculum sp.]MDE2545980.1 DUF5714 domain-containing protein [Methanocorpusculum sp.]
MTEEKRPNTCLICGFPMITKNTPERMECAICRKTFTDTTACVNGHYVCSDCWNHPGAAVIRSICTSTKSKNPVSLAVMMMNSPAVYMHGADHHAIIAAALLAAYKNCGGEVDLNTAIDEAIRRGSAVPYGICATAGTSGGAVSAGIFYSIVAKTEPLSIKEWGEGNLLVSECLHKIGQAGGPRCCKRCTFFSLETAAAFITEHFGIQLEMPEKIRCGYVERNTDCNKERCPYFASITDY